MPVPKTTHGRHLRRSTSSSSSCPSMTESRRAIQATRVRSDRELLRLFGNRDEPAYPIENYLAGYDKIVHSLGVLEVGARRRILIVTGDPIGEKMAGPAIRATQMAKQLSGEHDVRVVSLTRSTQIDPSYEVVTVPHRHPRQMVEHEAWADVIIVQGHALRLFPVLESTAQDPGRRRLRPAAPRAARAGPQRRRRPVEPADPRRLGHAQPPARARRLLHLRLRAAAHVLARAARRLRPRERAHVLARPRPPQSLIGVVPFGLSSTPPVHDHARGQGRRAGHRQGRQARRLGRRHLRLVRPDHARPGDRRARRAQPDVKLFFMGVQHPNPDVPEMDIVAKVRARPADLGLTGKNVFFNDVVDPVRGARRLPARGRRRRLDALRAPRDDVLVPHAHPRLPVGAPADRDDGRRLVRRPRRRGAARRRRARAGHRRPSPTRSRRRCSTRRPAPSFIENVTACGEQFTWQNVLAPLVEFCRNPIRAADKTVRDTRPGCRSPRDARARAGPQEALRASATTSAARCTTSAPRARAASRARSSGA